MSRSEAKRILAGLEPFEEIIFDFKGVVTVGQGFVDEIFRVFAQRNPKKKLTVMSTSESVEFMIRRANKAEER